MKSRIVAFFAIILLSAVPVIAQHIPTGTNHGNKFEQLGTIIPDPNKYRSASGAPGPEYWQQKADYKITAELDDKNQILTGSEVITYYNQSPELLSYLWLQLDENEHHYKSDNKYFDPSKIDPVMSDMQLNRLEVKDEGLGVKIYKVTDANDKSLPYIINQTMLRIDLPQPLKPGDKFIFKVDWSYKISNRDVSNGRGGYEYFPEDKNYVYTIAQWYPRMAVYSDFQGWQNKQFTGRGEFALTFGDFEVKMTVPADHVVGATGQCQNYNEVLTTEQQKRWSQAQTAKEPVEIVTLQEAKAAESKRTEQKKTWHYKAENVRDFAWVSSRKLVWDAMATDIEGRKVMAMSYYSKEAYGLYRKYSTKAVAHTLKVYSKHSIPYPYPVAISVEASNGMEYPMICFNYGRPDKDGTYSQAVKYGMLSVIFHEVGHNFFPMIVNSDERQWSWMDEGLNTFLQFLTEQEWENNYPSQRGPANKIVDYMKLPKEQLEPIMTNSENIVQFGPNAYAKPATALNILRETIMGRELFDFAFKTYSQRWAFKHPTPADFFRTMEDASAVDLDWFWKGWFYSIDPVDIALDSVKWYKMDNKNLKPVVRERTIKNEKPFDHISKVRNKESGMAFSIEKDPTLIDFYNSYEAHKEDPEVKVITKLYEETLSNQEKEEFLKKNYYQLSFSNKGGCVMPIIVQWTFKDGTKEIDRIPAYIWRKNENTVTKVFVKEKEVQSIELDPLKETADIDPTNNQWPLKEMPSKFQTFKQKTTVRGMSTGENPMQRVKQKK